MRCKKCRYRVRSPRHKKGDHHLNKIRTPKIPEPKKRNRQETEK